MEPICIIIAFNVLINTIPLTLVIFKWYKRACMGHSKMIVAAAENPHLHMGWTKFLSVHKNANKVKTVTYAEEGKLKIYKTVGDDDEMSVMWNGMIFHVHGGSGSYQLCYRSKDSGRFAELNETIAKTAGVSFLH